MLVPLRCGWRGFGVQPDVLCCLPDACGDLVVTLQSVSRQGEKRSLQLAGSRDSVPFTFEGVLPGKYKGRTRGPACGGPWELNL